MDKKPTLVLLDGDQKILSTQQGNAIITLSVNAFIVPTSKKLSWLFVISLTFSELNDSFLKTLFAEIKWQLLTTASTLPLKTINGSVWIDALSDLFLRMIRCWWLDL